MIRGKIVSIIFVILAFLLQTTVFRKLELAEVVPNLLLVTTISYGYLRGRTTGIICGFFCGIILDMTYGSVIGLYALIFMSIGFIVGYCQKIYFRNSMILPIILISIGDFLYGIYFYITEFLMRGRLNFIFYFLHRILPEIIYTTLIGIMFYQLILLFENKVLKLYDKSNL